MAFDRGPVTFRVCLLPQALPDDVLERFALKAAEPLDRVTDEPQYGWVSGRHLLEARIDEETAYAGGYPHLQLRTAQRRIPAALLRAECRMAELALMAETKSDSVNRKERLRIKKEATERLLPKMPPQISGIPFAVDASAGLLYTAAVSDKQFDLFVGAFKSAVGFEPVPLTPEAYAVSVEIGADEVAPINFSPEQEDAETGGSLGQNFLTWLWWYQETHNGELPKTQLGEFSLLLDGPLLLVAETAGAFESSIKKGTPTISAEAKAALVTGKKLKRAKLRLQRDQEAWETTLDADNFVFRGLRLPEGEAMDHNGIFEERMTAIFIFQKVFYSLFRRFLDEFKDDKKRQDFQKKAKKWVADRRAN